MLRQYILEVEKNLSQMSSFFNYKAGLIQKTGRKLNDYSLHYLVFSLGDIFESYGKMTGSAMVSFDRITEEPIGNFWNLVDSYCENFDSSLQELTERETNFAEKIKRLCRRRNDINFDTSGLSQNPDTQRLLDFMQAVEKSKTTTGRSPKGSADVEDLF